ncbi:hypothetical protein C8R43DRAFT_1232080 [Mycena crocata]|nr:hypothetical protein C8R43DRAFT_1232080 [Mycena crocata]
MKETTPNPEGRSANAVEPRPVVVENKPTSDFKPGTGSSVPAAHFSIDWRVSLLVAGLLGCGASTALPHSAETTITSTPTSPTDFSRSTVNLAARLDEEAANANSLTALILAFANGTAINLIQRRQRDIEHIALELLETDLPNNSQLYDEVNAVASDVLVLRDKMVAVNSFGSTALNFFIREYALLESDVQKTFSSPTHEKYAVLANHAEEFVERSIERISEYIVLVEDAYSYVLRPM